MFVIVFVGMIDLVEEDVVWGCVFEIVDDEKYVEYYDGWFEWW